MSVAKNLYKQMSILLYESAEPNKEDYSNDLDFLSALWKYYNQTYFNSQLKEPKFRWLRTKMGTSDRFEGGHWEILTNTLVMNQRFLMYLPVFKDILKHEMCHQAVTEIDQVREKRFHGAVWKTWAKKVGIDTKGTLRISPDIINSMRTESEKEYQQNMSLFGSYTASRIKSGKLKKENIYGIA